MEENKSRRCTFPQIKVETQFGEVRLVIRMKLVALPKFKKFERPKLLSFLSILKITFFFTRKTKLKITWLQEIIIIYAK